MAGLALGNGTGRLEGQPGRARSVACTGLWGPPSRRRVRAPTSASSSRCCRRPGRAAVPPACPRPALLNATRVAVAFALMVVPATATRRHALPLLARALERRDSSFPARVGPALRLEHAGSGGGRLPGRRSWSSSPSFGVRGTGARLAVLDLGAAAAAPLRRPPLDPHSVRRSASGRQIRVRAFRRGPGRRRRQAEPVPSRTASTAARTDRRRLHSREPPPLALRGGVVPLPRPVRHRPPARVFAVHARHRAPRHRRRRALLGALPAAMPTSAALLPLAATLGAEPHRRLHLRCAFAGGACAPGWRPR